jgi:A-factor biosynthesis hotdog domain
MAGHEDLPALSFEQTVPRATAHRRALGEVFITDSAEAGDGEYALGYQIPRAHSLWNDRRVPYHDSFSTAEAARQAVFVVLHRHAGVPLGLPFTLHRFRFRVVDLAAYRDTRSPLEGTLRLRLAGRRRRGADLEELSVEGTLAVGDRAAMSMSGEVAFLPTDDYHVLREYQRSRRTPGADPAPAPEPVDPALVGRSDRRNVVVGAPAATDEACYPLLVDQSHPSFFDHDYDHVPGPLIVEGFRQTALVAAAAQGAISSALVPVTGCAATFSDFAEFEAALECRPKVSAARPDGPVTVDIELHQFGRQIATGSIELGRYPQ